MSMSHRRILGFTVGAVLTVVVGVSLASAMSGACDSKPASAEAVKDGAGGCGSKVMTATGSCASSCSSMKQADLVMPEDVRIQTVEVEGGVDMVFTSADLAAVESFIRSRLSACSNNTEGKTCALKADVVTGEESVTLSVRGELPEGCCAGSLMEKAEEAADASCETPKST